MLRRCFLTVALGACAVAPMWAQDRATYVLTNGERHNGLIVYGRGDNHIVDDKFHINSSGRQLVFEPDDVAVIDFVGGTPDPAELEALPRDTQLMVLRNGSTQRGRLHNLLRLRTPTRVDVVQWVNEAGQRNNIPIGEVRRLYLKPDNARTSFFGTGQSPAAAAGTVLEPGAVRVDAVQQWNSTGINVRAGDSLSFRATGRVSFGQGAAQTAGPDGNDSLRGGTYPVPAMPVGGLIGRVGNSAPFPIGSNTQPIRMPANGTLMLGVNDAEVGDNSGFFSVVVNRR